MGESTYETELLAATMEFWFSFAYTRLLLWSTIRDAFGAAGVLVYASVTTCSACVLELLTLIAEMEE